MYGHQAGKRCKILYVAQDIPVQDCTITWLWSTVRLIVMVIGTGDEFLDPVNEGAGHFGRGWGKHEPFP